RVTGSAVASAPEMLRVDDTHKRSGWRILICDDRGAHRTMVRRLLHSLGIDQVMEAPVMFGRSGSVLRFQPQLVLGRIRPDHQEVLELIRWLRTPELSPLPGVPVLVSASSADKALLT